MTTRSLVAVLAMAAFAIACLISMSAVALDSEDEVATDQSERVGPSVDPRMEGDRQFEPRDRPKPLGPDFPPKDGQMRGPAPPHVDPNFRPAPAPAPYVQPLAPVAPPSGQPVYEHDADDELLSASLKPMIEGDITIFDPGFVEDAIKYAIDNGMESIAAVLEQKLAANFESYLRAYAVTSSANSRASGFDEELDDEVADFEVVEEEEEDESPVFFDEPSPIIFTSFSPRAEPLFVLLEL